ncbi:hypothetical protein M8J75_003528 [Diaphorina citri]|nr:hypothetical protein M8J75_003528 [Diaphorina citri]
MLNGVQQFRRERAKRRRSHHHHTGPSSPGEPGASTFPEGRPPIPEGRPLRARFCDWLLRRKPEDRKRPRDGSIEPDKPSKVRKLEKKKKPSK